MSLATFAPPSTEGFEATVSLISVALLKLPIPPLVPSELLPETVLFMSVSSPGWNSIMLLTPMPPAKSPALLSENALSVTLAVPPTRRPPAVYWAWLPEIVLWTIVSVDPICSSMPPPTGRPPCRRGRVVGHRAAGQRQRAVGARLRADLDAAPE